MTTLLLATIVYFFYCAFVYVPESSTTTTTDADITPAYEEATPTPIPQDWTVLDNVITFPQPTATPLTLEPASEEALQGMVDDLAGLRNYTIRELKKIASFYHVPRYSSLKKQALVEAIERHLGIAPQAA